MADEPTKSEVASVHDTYGIFLPRWNLYVRSYEGGKDYTDPRPGETEYLQKHAREEDGDYDDRKSRAYYLNYCRPIIDTYINHLAKVLPQRRYDKKPDYDEFLDDVDFRGTSMNSFVFDRLAPYAQISGVVWTVLDLPMTDKKPMTRKDQEDTNIRPYLSIVLPQNITNWQIDEFGKLVWVVVRRERDKELTRYYVYSRSKWQIYEEAQKEEVVTESRAKTPETEEEVGRNLSLIKDGEHNLGEVPVVPCYNTKSRIYHLMGVSALNDIAPINKTLFNVTSYLDEFLRKQSFPILTGPVEAMPSSQGQDESPSGKPHLEIGQSNVIGIPLGAERGFEWLAPEVEAGRYYLEVLDKLRKNIYKLAMIDDTWAEKPAPESGIARAYRLHDANQNLSKKSLNLETWEQTITRLFFKYLGKEETAEEIQIEYNREFDVKTANERLGELFDILERPTIGPTFKKEIKRRVVDVALPDVDDGIYEKIIEEIESMPDEEFAEHFRPTAEVEE